LTPAGRGSKVRSPPAGAAASSRVERRRPSTTPAGSPQRDRAAAGAHSARKSSMVEAGKLIKELQGMRDEGHLSDALLRHAVRTLSKDERFSWVGVYLLGDEGLWLHNYVGEPTEHAKIPVGTGVCGRAVAERRNLNIPDVSKEENYLACSPD